MCVCVLCVVCCVLCVRVLCVMCVLFAQCVLYRVHMLIDLGLLCVRDNKPNDLENLLLPLVVVVGVCVVFVLCVPVSYKCILKKDHHD